MPRYLEYDKATGKILCTVTAPAFPSETETTGYFEIPDGLNLDTGNTLVQGGRLIQAAETQEERRERERLAREARDRAKRQYKGRLWQFLTELAHSYDRETGGFPPTTGLVAAQDAIFELDKWLV